MLDILPIEILREIYQYLSPEQAPNIALIDKKHAQFVSDLFWKRKFEIHFSYLLNELSKDDPRNWYTLFFKAYDQEYAKLSKPQRAWFSLVKEGKLNKLADLSIDDFLSLNDAKGISLMSWAKKNQHQHILDYFWNEKVSTLSLNLKDKSGNSILHLAVLLNQKKSVDTLISSDKIQVDIKNSSRCTPFIWQPKKVMRILLKYSLKRAQTSMLGVGRVRPHF